MSGNRGFLSKAQTKLFEEQRRNLALVPEQEHARYFEVLKDGLGKMYESFGLVLPKVYRFASPLACILSLPHVIKLNSQEDIIHSLSDLRNSLSQKVAAETERDIGGIMDQAMGIHQDEQMSELFRENFVQQMKEQCAGKEKQFVDLLKGFNPDFYGGKLWWQSIAGGMWVWPYDKFVIVSDRPTRCETDDRRRSHCENDAAIEFADGYRVWAWHGVLVPFRIILFPESLNFIDVEKEQNLEIRRIITERMGFKKYLAQAGAVLEDMDTLTLDGSAARALMRDKLGNKWLIGTDGSTARVYTMAVPAEVKTCREAHEAICGFEESRLIAEA